MVDPVSKRLRLSWASPGGSAPGPPLQIVPASHHGQQDLIEFFAERGQRKKELEDQVHVLEARLQDLQTRLSRTEATVTTQKVLPPYTNGG